MNTQLPYIILAIIVLLIVAALVFFVGKNKSKNRLTPLAGLAFGFILAGILFGENRILGLWSHLCFIPLRWSIVARILDLFIWGRWEGAYPSPVSIGFLKKRPANLY
jgi:hypothetical protein